MGYESPALNSPTTTGLPEVWTTSAEVAPHSRSSMAAACAPRSMSGRCAGSMLTVGISTMRPRRSSKRPRTLWVYDSSLRGSGVGPFIGRLLTVFEPRESTTGRVRRTTGSWASACRRAQRPQSLPGQRRGVVAGPARNHDHRVAPPQDGPVGRGSERGAEFARVLRGVPEGREDRDGVVTVAIVLPSITAPAGGPRVGPTAQIFDIRRIEHVHFRPRQDREHQLAKFPLALEHPPFA